MSQDPTIEIAQVRNILRRSVVSGRRTAAANRALRRLHRISVQAGDSALHYEHRRWSVQLGLLRSV